ncbi:VOC family protein [Moraxella nasovis]|uniref:2-oxoadipate dioxygenase/decarboxylase HglS n=1 Tax=Moraxella nasovis TaxID=2904121 RepID=UPI001F61735D|nr:VOC family protein [Moraxella nasovis]UNU72662.1 VOC family protein [Moraxella nasovis]
MSQFTQSQFQDKDSIRHAFSLAMSKMYQSEVPLYKELMDLVADVNKSALDKDPTLKQHLANTGELDRIDLERHGAIRLGLPSELNMMRRLFSVMGMSPVGYYDLTPAGVPVHSTAFRTTDSDGLQKSPFRVFCSLLRLELIDDDKLRQQAIDTLNKRQIFTPRVIELIQKSESQGGLNKADSDEFVIEATKTFKWHTTSPISKELYDKLHNQHRLMADIVGFYGPHINHLTPRTLDIDKVQTGMSERGIDPKEIIEGPPRRSCPILLRQTSFKALNEPIAFTNADGTLTQGNHTARFGEIEQRGIALTPKGRKLYDELLNKTRANLATTPEKDPDAYYQALADSFRAFPDDYQEIYEQSLGYFYYQINESQINDKSKSATSNDPKELVKQGILRLEPIVYEDFLPVSAAGIFQSNLGDNAQDKTKSGYERQSSQAVFEDALGATVLDECVLYQAMMDKSLDDALIELGLNS